MDPITSSLPVADGLTLLVRHWPNLEGRAVLLIVHGVSEHSGRWTHVVDSFVDRGYDVWAFDQRGHGGSGGKRLDMHRFDDLVDDLAAVVAHCRDDRPLVVYGHSMGGLVATAYACSDRSQPDAFVLSAPALGAKIPRPLEIGGRILDRILPGARIPAPIDPGQLSRDPGVGERFVADPLVHLVPTARFGARFLDAMTATTASIGRIHVPTLVIHGGEDTLVPTDVSSPLGDVAGVERKVFAGLRHEMHNEPEAAEVLDYVAAWLDIQLDTQLDDTLSGR